MVPSARRSLLQYCAALVFFHTCTSYLEELLFKELKWKSGSSMMLYLSLLYACMYVVAKCTVYTKIRITIPLERSQVVDVVVICLVYCTTNTISKYALNFVSIPLQMVFKSCKLVAVMLGSGLIFRRFYSMGEYLTAVCLVTGMVSFAYGDRASSSTDESRDLLAIGTLLLLFALSLDAVLGNLQERIQKTNTCSELELMFLQSVVSGAAILAFTALTGELREAIALCYADPHVLPSLTAWAVSNLIGSLVLLRIVKEFSAVVAVLTTNLGRTRGST